MDTVDSKSMGSASSSTEVAQSVEAVDVQARFDAMASSRSEIIRRAEECSKVTIPHLFKETGVSESDTLPTPYQSLGARLLNNLSNKLLLTLFPTNTPYFKLAMAEAITQELEKDGATNIRNEMEKALIRQESIIQRDMEVYGFRHKLHEALRHLICVGNFLLYVPPKGELVGYRLDQYVVKRAVSGKVLEIIIREGVSYFELPPEWQQQVETLCSKTGDEEAKKQTFTMYTRIHLAGNKYKEAKYIKGEVLEGSEGQYPEDASAWIPLRWTGASNEDYGRGYVEEYLGDFQSHEGLSKAILQTSALASKTFGILRNGSTIRPQDIANVANGGVVQGEPDDIVYPEIGKYNDLRTAREQIESLTYNLSQAFLVTQVRDSERTTAEEVRQGAQELEIALGGAYSLLATTLQAPLLARERARLVKSKDLIALPNDDVDPKIVVGLEGLGRGTDLDKLNRATAMISAIAPSAQFIQKLSMDKLVEFVFNAVGLKPNGILLSDEEFAQKMQAEQAQQAQAQGQELMNSAVSAGTKPLVEGAINEPEQTQQVVDNIQGALNPQQ